MEAICIALGVAIFSLSKKNIFADDVTFWGQVIGFVCLSVYILSDAFTSQWQSRLYAQYGRVDSFQMMFGINVFSLLFTCAMLVVSGEIPLVIDFLQNNPSCFYYVILTSISSSSGQMATYYTIKRFGPVVFTVIMTTRQILSILLSNIIFKHTMEMQNYIGVTLVFGIVGLRIYRKVREVGLCFKLYRAKSCHYAILTAIFLMTVPAAAYYTLENVGPGFFGSITSLARSQTEIDFPLLLQCVSAFITVCSTTAYIIHRKRSQCEVQ